MLFPVHVGRSLLVHVLVGMMVAITLNTFRCSSSSSMGPWYPSLADASKLNQLNNPSNTRMLVVLHRHGVRDPGIYNPTMKKVQWDLCQLKPEGAEQLKWLGRTLGDTYRTMFGTEWDLKSVLSFSTSYPFAQQSAQSFLRGIYPSEIAPQLQSLQPPISNFVLPMTLPTLVLHSHKKKATDLMNDLFEAKTTSVERGELDAVMKTEQMCQTPSSGASCFTTYIDYLRYAEAVNKSPPSLSNTLRDKMIELWRLRNHRLFAWMLDDKFQQEYIPSLGAPLAQLILKHMNTKDIKLVHFSVHDETLTALYHTLGLIGPSDIHSEYNEVGFAETIIFEVRNDNTFIVIKGKPKYPDVMYDFETLAIDCGGATKESVCNVDKWAAAVAKVSPRDPLGCYASPKDHEDQGCTVSMNAPGKPVTSACVQYRRTCPQYGCVANTISNEYVVDFGEPATLPCMSTMLSTKTASPTTPLNTATPTTVCNVVIASFVFLFLLLGIFVLILYNRKIVFKDKLNMGSVLLHNPSSLNDTHLFMTTTV